jgi:hypothetical protein
MKIACTFRIVWQATHRWPGDHPVRDPFCRPKLDLVMKHVAIGQVGKTKLLGVTLDCKLSGLGYHTADQTSPTGSILMAS